MVRGVEHKADVVVFELLEGLERKSREDTLSLIFGVRRSVDCPHGALHAASVNELPAHEHADADEPSAVESEPRDGRAERVRSMLPSEQRLVPLIWIPAEAVSKERENGREVGVGSATDLEHLQSSHCRATRRNNASTCARRHVTSTVPTLFSTRRVNVL